MEPKYLNIDLSVRLPDIKSEERLPPEFDEYGRIAVTTNNTIVVSPIRSAHPLNTKEGFYYALSFEKDTLFLSPRGAAYDWEKYITDELIRTVVERLGLKAKYRYFKR